MGKRDAQDDVQVVPSHQALSVVGRWLGLDAQAALEQQGPDGTELVKRPPMLGLGAKYLPHHKAVGYAAAVDQKLGKRLEAGRRRAAAQLGEEQDAAAAWGQGQQVLSRPGPSGYQAGSEDEEDEEVRGKAGMVRRRIEPTRPAQQIGPKLAADATSSRVSSKAAREAELFGLGQVGDGLAQGDGKLKKKKKKHKKRKAETVAPQAAGA